MKEYFAHDYSASRDLKMQVLLEKHGVIAYGFFWLMVEEMHQSGGSVAQGRHKAVARMHEVRNADAIMCTMLEVGLFVEIDGLITSTRILKGLEERGLKSNKAKESANSRWERIANAMRTHNERNAIKEKESKDIALNKNLELVRATKFSRPSLADVTEYMAERGCDAQEAERFIDHYTANGWKVGRNAMKDWKAAVRNWTKNKTNYSGQGNAQRKRGDRNQDGSINIVEYSRQIEEVIHAAREARRSQRELVPSVPEAADDLETGSLDTGNHLGVVDGTPRDAIQPRSVNGL